MIWKQSTKRWVQTDVERGYGVFYGGSGHPGGENHEYQQKVLVWAKIWNRNMPDRKQECWLLECDSYFDIGWYFGALYWHGWLRRGWRPEKGSGSPFSGLLFHLNLQFNWKKAYYSQDLCRRLPLVTGVRIAFASRKCVAHKVLRKWFPPPILFPRNFE